MRAADRRFVRSEEGFTLVELLVVLVTMAILLADATARANLRTAIPAIPAYRSDAGRMPA